MLAIFKREITSFLTSATGYLVLGLFLVLNGLFLWVFKGPYNILEFGFADLSAFFLLAPSIFLFLIPAITMKSFSEEKKLGTLELLLIKPISVRSLVLGKFFGTLGLATLAIVPTVIYVFCISQLGTTTGNLDMGLVLGSYLGMILLIAAYTAIGLFASALSENQIVAFLTGLVFCFVAYYGFQEISTLFSEGAIALVVSQIGMEWHFERMGSGVIDTRDLVYFVSITLFFLYITTNLVTNISRT
jgi:ABC-2 type transport system permease protein